ncbi:MAG: hypothetical protein ABF289_13285 [Clostridiales bacterium]
MKKRFVLIFSISVFLLIFSGCEFQQKSVSKVVNENKLSASDNSKIEKSIKNFIKEIYSTNLEDNYSNTEKGNINSNIKDFISKQTIEEADENLELPIHYPRYISINGLTLLNYKISNSNKEDEILINKIGESKWGYTYYVKINLIADGVENGQFDKYFNRNEKSGIYAKIPGSKIEIKDKIKIQAKYDVKIIKEEKAYKIQSFTESCIKPLTKNRLSVSNSDCIRRIPYLNIEDSENKMIKADKDDIKLFKSDSKIIDNFFSKIKDIDSIRMDLLKSNWEKDKKNFTDFLFYIGLENGKEIDVGTKEEYKNNFSIESFPIRFGMERIVKIKDIKTNVHIGYSENNPIYNVEFTAQIEENDGVISNPNEYNYEYMIWIKDKSIVKIKLIDTYKALLEDEENKNKTDE